VNVWKERLRGELCDMMMQKMDDLQVDKIGMRFLGQKFLKTLKIGDQRRKEQKRAREMKYHFFLEFELFYMKL
jgi:hypothetical protein